MTGFARLFQTHRLPPFVCSAAGLRAVFPCTNMAEQAQDAEGDPKRDRAESYGNAPGKCLLFKSRLMK